MILLDTNVLSELMRTRPNDAVLDWVDAQPVATLFISAVTRAEIGLGIELLPDGQRKRDIAATAQAVFDEFTARCLPFGELPAVHYARVVANRTRQRRPIAVEDAQIAAIALANGLRLATRNVKDFAGIADLELINPWLS